jgi:precorrin-6B methylase 2
MRHELVKKIDENFLKHGSREELVEVILELLNIIQEQSKLVARVADLENEIRALKGEKKSPSLTQR